MLTIDEPAYTEETLSSMKKAELLTLAESLSVEDVSSANTKAQIIAAILEVI